jgi:hypothetical protein
MPLKSWSMLLLSLYLCSASCEAAEPLRVCGRPFTTIDRFLAEIQRLPGIKQQPNNRNIDVFLDREGLIIWAFYQRPHPAAPAVVCSHLTQDEDGSWARSDHVLCGAPKPVCDALRASYDELARTMRRKIEGN